MPFFPADIQLRLAGVFMHGQRQSGNHAEPIRFLHHLSIAHTRDQEGHDSALTGSAVIRAGGGGTTLPEAGLGNGHLPGKVRQPGGGGGVDVANNSWVEIIL